jgi:hypothetical protein
MGVEVRIMARTTQKERADFIARLVTESKRHGPEMCTEIGYKILKLSARYCTLQEHDCNRGLTDKERQLESGIERRIRLQCRELGPGFAPVFQGDPRGATVKLKVPSGFYNDWGQTGLCVPTS